MCVSVFFEVESHVVVLQHVVVVDVVVDDVDDDRSAVVVVDVPVIVVELCEPVVAGNRLTELPSTAWPLLVECSEGIGGRGDSIPFCCHSEPLQLDYDG